MYGHNAGRNARRFCFLGRTGATAIATIFGQGEVVVVGEGVWMIETFLSHTRSVNRCFVCEPLIDLHTLLGPGRGPVSYIE